MDRIQISFRSEIFQWFIAVKTIHAASYGVFEGQSTRQEGVQVDIVFLCVPKSIHMFFLCKLAFRKKKNNVDICGVNQISWSSSNPAINSGVKVNLFTS